MKVLTIILLLTGMTAAQTIHRLTPGTKDNKLILTVENESNEAEITNIKTAVIKQPAAIIFGKKEISIDKIVKCGESEIEFTFDVARIAGAGRTDTIKFLISSKRGNWEKEILVGYELPSEFRLEQNYPNPFNPTTTIEFAVPASSLNSSPYQGKGQRVRSENITLIIYDVLGREVAKLIDEQKEPGYYKYEFNASKLSSGIYFYRLTCGELNIIKKMMLLK